MGGPTGARETAAEINGKTQRTRRAEEGVRDVVRIERGGGSAAVRVFRTHPPPPPIALPIFPAAYPPGRPFRFFKGAWVFFGGGRARSAAKAQKKPKPPAPRSGVAEGLASGTKKQISLREKKTKIKPPTKADSGLEIGGENKKEKKENQLGALLAERGFFSPTRLGAAAARPFGVGRRRGAVGLSHWDGRGISRFCKGQHRNRCLSVGAPAGPAEHRTQLMILPRIGFFGAGTGPKKKKKKKNAFVFGADEKLKKNYPKTIGRKNRAKGGAGRTKNEKTCSKGAATLAETTDEDDG